VADQGQALADKPADAVAQSSDGVHVRFDPGQGASLTFGAVPWPDDLYLDKQAQDRDKQARVMLSDFPSSRPSDDYPLRLRNSLPDLDGFGITTPVFFFLDGDLDASSLPETPDDSVADDSSVFLIDADTGSPDAFQRVPVELQWSSQYRRLALRPALGHPLMPGRRYAALVTQRVLDKGGRPLQPSAKFATARDSAAPLTDADGQLHQARDEYTPVLQTLAKMGTLPRDVVGMAVFRVQTVGGDFTAARRIVRTRTMPAPTSVEAIDKSGLDAVLGKPSQSPTAAPHDRLLGMIHGKLSSPNFVSASDKIHGAWQHDETGSLQPKRNEDVFFTLFVPKGSEPASIVIYQHQRGHERSDAVFVANALAAHNIAVIAIDAPYQGMRVPSDATRVPDTKNRFTGASTPDRFGDEPGDFYGADDTQGPLHPFYARDALRQGVVDLMNVVRFLEAGDFSAFDGLGAVGARKYDVRSLGFIGEDIGAQMGVMLTSVEPRVQALALVGASAFVTQGLWLDPADQALFTQLSGLLGRTGPVDYELDSPRFWPELAIFETLLGRGEPLAYASALRRSPANVLLMMAAEDEVVANLTTEALSVSLGASLISGQAQYARDLTTHSATAGEMISGNYAVEDEHVTRLLRMYAPADHRMLLSSQGMHVYEAPVRPPFQARSAPETFANPQSAALEDLGNYFDSFFACVGSSSASSAMPCEATVTAP
jgi:hypothetical protein